MTKSKTPAKKDGGEKVASATTSRTGQVGAAETTVTPVEKANDEAAKASKAETHGAPKAAKASAKEAPAREGHAVGVPRKTVEQKFGPKSVSDEDIAASRLHNAVLGGI